MSNYQVWNQVWYHPCYLLISTNSTNLYEIEKGSLWVRGVISKSSDCWMLPITLKFLLSHKKTFSDMHCLITRFRVSNSTKSVTVVPFLPLASLTHLHSRMIYQFMKPFTVITEQIWKVSCSGDALTDWKEKCISQCTPHFDHVLCI